MPRLCAFGCKTNDIPTHRFPNPYKFPEQFKTWVTLVGGKLEKSSDYEYYRKKIICDKHFTDADKTHSNWLNRLAVPSLYLAGTLHNSQANIHGQDSISNLEEVSRPAPPQVALPPPNMDELGTWHSSQANINGQASTSNSEQVSCPAPPQAALPTTNTSIGVIQDTTARDSVMKEHNYTVISRPKWTNTKHWFTVKSACTSIVHPLRTKIKRLRTEISRLRKKGKSFAARLANAEDLASNTAFQDVIRNMTKPARLFLQMQQQSSKKSKGRRFTIEEKVLSLSIYKKSPKCYAMLHKYFTLPSIKAMKRLLSQIKLRPGINPIIFKKIRQTVAKQNVSDRLCSLMFDEMSLTPQLFYNAQKDTIEGFACNQEKMFADHALVFMVKGIKHNFKQPIAYYFTSGLQKTELRNIIVDVIEHAQKSGLIIVNTVCDQSTVNVGAITELVNRTKADYVQREKEWRDEHFDVNGKSIVPIYDTPHLIKGIRNNLMTKDMRYVMNDEERVVKWQYYQMLYAADKSYGELRLVDKLTEEHVNPQRIKKMRVKFATQLFSHSVAVAAEHLTARGDLPTECRQLIDITLILDNLFDSLNSNTLSIPNGKIYKGPIKRNSPHHELWKKCKTVLKTIKFVKHQKTNGNKIRIIETTIPSVANFIKTIEGVETIWKILSGKYAFDMMLTRHFNQDPIENFFGNIRSYGARNNAPNTVAFEGAFKALLLNNYNSPHSSRANCEEDSNKCLQTLDFFLKEKHATVSPIEREVNCNAEIFSLSPLEVTDAGQRNYVCGWVLTKCLKNIVKSCRTCREQLVDGKDINKKNKFIKSKEYSTRRWLCYPSEDFVNCFHDIQNLTTSFLRRNVPKINVKKDITAITDVLVEYPFKCTEHREKLIAYFTNVTTNVIIHSWCRSVNRILCGKLNYNGEDETKTAAQVYYNKRKHYKSK